LAHLGIIRTNLTIHSITIKDISKMMITAPHIHLVHVKMNLQQTSAVLQLSRKSKNST
jgi:hypothetical protein